MRKRRLLVATALALTACTPVPSMAKNLTIALDLSGSNPLLVDKHFNRRAAEYVVQQMDGLKQGDSVEVKFIGSLSATHNFQRIKKTVKRHNLKKLKVVISNVIKTLSKQAQAQGSTNLLAFWGRNRFDCQSGDSVIVLTDAIESSEYIESNALLSGKAKLPKPNEFVQLQGCSIQYFGIGVGRSDQEMLTLRRQWKAYFESAGAAFKAGTL